VVLSSGFLCSLACLVFVHKKKQAARMNEEKSHRALDYYATHDTEGEIRALFRKQKKL
jgi:hypothetical protein